MSGPRTKPFITRAGGKTCLLKHLLPRIPTDGVRCYVEAFGGGGAVLLARPRIKGTVEVYNDIDADLVNAFRQVKEHGPEVIRQLEGRVNSRREFMRVRDAARDSRTDLQRAADWIWLNRISFGGNIRDFGVKKTSSGGGAALRLASCFDLVENAHKRLSGVIIEELPWQRLVKNYDGAGTFFFFDPPYFGDTQKTYRGWTQDQLAELIAALRTLKGNWLMTFGDQPDVREMCAGFSISTVDRQLGLRKNGNSSRYHELIIEPAY